MGNSIWNREEKFGEGEGKRDGGGKNGALQGGLKGAKGGGESFRKRGCGWFRGGWGENGEVVY